jgi:iron(II)-dependent oxidoreductase
MRIIGKDDMRRALLQARQHTTALVDDLDDAQWRVPKLPIVNPMLWEVGHVGWFMEHWCLRWRGPQRPPAPSLLDHADRWYDSRTVAHATRWDLDLPSRSATLRYLADVLEATLERLERTDDDPAALYFFQLALYHEDMHCEAFAYTRQTCGYPAPAAARAAPVAGDGDVALAGGEFGLGAPAGEPGFVFDNEKWCHAARVAPFSIARRPVSQGEFAAFVDDGGYRRRELWSEAGLRWLDEGGATCPRYWRRGDSGWQSRRFDRWLPLDGGAPMVHVTRHEAEAWCRWARRRLPTESERECAAVAGAVDAGGVWEWTASDFLPYPGFAPDPYAEYSAPWFGTHVAVRGGSSATPARIVHPRFRNFYLPDRGDIFVGFRTCALT